MVGGLPGLAPWLRHHPIDWHEATPRHGWENCPRSRVLPPPTREAVHQAAWARRRAGLCAAVSRAGPAPGRPQRLRDASCRTAAPQSGGADVAPV